MTPKTASAIVRLLWWCLLIDGCLGRSSGFYADNGIDQTVMYQQISKKERREMQQEILSLLGLHHRPKPTPHGTENSAPKYMMDLYNSIVEDEDGDDGGGTYLKIDRGRRKSNNREGSSFNNNNNNNSSNNGSNGNGTLLESQGDQDLLRDDDEEDSLMAIGDADVIMSFVNHGWRKVRRCRKLKLGARSKQATCKKGSKKPIAIKAGHHMSHIRHDKDRRFWFDVSEVPPEETIVEAQLRLYKEGVPRTDGEEEVNCNITVFELVQGLDPEDKELHYLDSVNVSIEHTGWIRLNVSSAASDWVFFPEKNQGLYLTIQREGQTHELHPREIGLIGNKGPADRQPFMVAFFKTPHELRHVRRTRAVNNNKQRKDVSYKENEYDINHYLQDLNIMKRSCQTRTLYVSFKELGWQNWIIAPDGYSAFYCKGECSFPLNAQMNATNHAIVQTLVNLMKPHNVPKPCCAPTKLSSISVLYFDDNSNVILKKYKNMVVKACGCH